MKKWFKSKTMWLGFAVGFLGVIQSTLESAPMSAEMSGIILAVVGALSMYLRSITTKAIGSG